VLLISRLLDEDQSDLCVARMAQLSIACRKAFVSNGSPYWKAELGRGLQVGDSLYFMYCNLGSRRASLEKAARKEVVKSALQPAASKKDGEFLVFCIVLYLIVDLYFRKAKRGQGMVVGFYFLTFLCLPCSQSSNRSSMFNKKATEAKPAAVVPSSGKSKEIISKFRSAVNRGAAQFSISPWRRRLFEVMLDTKGATDEYKSNALLEYFESELTHVWLYCKYVAHVLELFKIGVAAKSSMGSYRVQLLVMLFDRIVDLHNFELVLMVLSAEEHACVLARIGLFS
jgi:hypothetical protein